MTVSKGYLSVFIFALNEDVLEEVVVVLLHLLVGDVGQVGPVSGLNKVVVAVEEGTAQDNKDVVAVEEGTAQDNIHL